MTLKVRILQSLTRLFIILVSLMMSLFSEKMLIFNRCISGSMSNLIEKSWKVSSRAVGRSGNLSGQVIIQGLLKKRLCVYSNKNLGGTIDPLKSLGPLWFKMSKPVNFKSLKCSPKAAIIFFSSAKRENY